MSSERQKMLAGEMYDPLDPELAAARERARDLCQALNATREAQQQEAQQFPAGVTAGSHDRNFDLLRHFSDEFGRC